MVDIAAGGGAASAATSTPRQDTPSSAAFDQSVSSSGGSPADSGGTSTDATSNPGASSAAPTTSSEGGGTDATAASTAADAALPGVSAATTAARSAIESTWSAYETVTDTAGEIEKLNSDGDQVVLSATLEGKGKIGFGAKGRYGYDITVQQVGNSQTPGVADDANVQYDVSFSKNLLAGASFEPPIPYIDVEAELNIHSADTVTMRFETREEAAEAARILQRTALAESVRDAGSLAGSIASPLPGAGATSNPAANPLIEDGNSQPTPLPTDPFASATGVPAELAADALAPTPEELRFLEDHTISYSTTLGVQERNKFKASLPSVLGYELRVDPNAEVTRTVTLPRDGQPGELSYAIAGEVVASSKERLTIGPKLFEEFYAGYTPQNVVDHGSARRELTLSWDIDPAAFDEAPVVSGRPAPEAGVISNGRLGQPDRATLEITTQHLVQGLTDLSRTDMHRGTYTVDIADPDAADARYLSEMMTRLPVAGELPTPPADADITFKGERVDRSGVRQEHELGFEVFDVKGLAANLIVDVGRDDVSPLDLEPAPQPAPADPAPTGNPNQLVVTPRVGLNLRATPSTEGERAAVFQNGTFLQDSGERATDGQGREWARVSGPDVSDQQVEGWVPTAYVEPHPEGAMDETGRINPDLEADGYQEHLVQDGDNLWDLAKQYGVDFQNMVMLNDEHVIDPSLIFEGDTVYIPGTANPPAPVVDATPPVAPSTPPNESTGAGGPYMPVPGADSRPPSTPPNAPTAPAPSTPPSADSTGAPSTSSSTTPPAHTAPETPTPPAQAPAAVDDQAELDRIREEYQVVDDTIVDYTPNLGPWPIDVPFVGSTRMTQREADALDELGRRRGLLGLHEFRNIASNDPDDLGLAYTTADEYFPQVDAEGNVVPGGEDGHNDAFRHAYLNALLTDRFGEDFAETFATAHEGVPGNPADKEAMDLYNNELGRRIARDNPDASDEELAQLVYEAVINGEALVIDGNRELAFSDQVEVGQTGEARPGAADGVITPPELTNSN